MFFDKVRRRRSPPRRRKMRKALEKVVRAEDGRV
jgi:hypothetical protein